MNSSDVQAIIAAIDRLTSQTHHKDVWDVISVVAVLLTLAVVAIYTVETSKLRKAAQLQLEEARIQNETGITPILMFDTEKTEKAGYIDETFVIRNLGFGPAFNVSIEPDCDDITLDSPSHVGQRQAIPTGIILDFELPSQRTLYSVSKIRERFLFHLLPEQIVLTIYYESANRTALSTRLALKYNPDTNYVFIRLLGVKGLPSRSNGKTVEQQAAVELLPTPAERPQSHNRKATILSIIALSISVVSGLFGGLQWWEAYQGRRLATLAQGPYIEITKAQFVNQSSLMMTLHNIGRTPALNPKSSYDVYVGHVYDPMSAFKDVTSGIGAATGFLPNIPVGLEGQTGSYVPSKNLLDRVVKFEDYGRMQLRGHISYVNDEGATQQISFCYEIYSPYGPGAPSAGSCVDTGLLLNH